MQKALPPVGTYIRLYVPRPDDQAQRRDYARVTEHHLRRVRVIRLRTPGDWFLEYIGAGAQLTSASGRLMHEYSVATELSYAKARDDLAHVQTVFDAEAREAAAKSIEHRMRILLFLAR